MGVFPRRSKGREDPPWTSEPHPVDWGPILNQKEVLQQHPSLFILWDP